MATTKKKKSPAIYSKSGVRLRNPGGGRTKIQKVRDYEKRKGQKPMTIILLPGDTSEAYSAVNKRNEPRVKGKTDKARRAAFKRMAKEVHLNPKITPQVSKHRTPSGAKKKRSKR
jgi:hypothetical protein